MTENLRYVFEGGVLLWTAQTLKSIGLLLRMNLQMTTDRIRVLNSKTARQ